MTEKIEDELGHRFLYHQPTSQAIADEHQTVRDKCQTLARHFDARLPDSREKSLAFTKLEEAMFWANAAIARIKNYEQRQ